nr:unnamed protein product [Digitaria exilis]
MPRSDDQADAARRANEIRQAGGDSEPLLCTASSSSSSAPRNLPAIPTTVLRSSHPLRRELVGPSPW